MENWQPVVGYEDDYEISDLGRLRRISRGPATRVGRVQRPGNRRGYVRYSLTTGNVGCAYSGHRLVWQAFRGSIPEGMHINHKNGLKTDNRLENLEVVTPSENTTHGFRVLGRMGVKNPHYGEDHGMAKVTWEKVREIRRLYAAGGVSQQKLADAFGIDQTNISRIIRRQSWAE